MKPVLDLSKEHRAITEMVAGLDPIKDSVVSFKGADPMADVATSEALILTAKNTAINMPINAIIEDVLSNPSQQDLTMAMQSLTAQSEKNE